MTTAYINSLQSVIGNSNQASMKARNLLNNGACQGQQHFLTSIPNDQNTNSNGDLENSSHNNVIYQQQVYPDYSQPGLFATVSSGGYYESTANAQIMSHNGETFIVHHGIADNEATTTLPHTIRAAPASVQWLHENYEPCEGISLPRSILYQHYLSHCLQAKLDPMNPASFGKLIRAVFPNLKTRRLGTRGNSQYHYQGIRIKSLSILNQVNEPFNPSRASNYHHHHYHHHNHAIKRKLDENIIENDALNQRSLTQHQNNQDFLGDVPPGAAEFVEVEIVSEDLPEGLVLDDVRAFETLYKDHCERIMEMVVNLQFSHIEFIWKQFWGSDGIENEMGDSEVNLGREKLSKLCRLPQILTYIKHADCMFYQALVNVLMPIILRPIPCSLTQNIRNFAKYLNEWMSGATSGMPQLVVDVKIRTVKALAQILRRYTSLNHLAQAARAVLQNPVQVAQMLADINKIDFSNVEEQASWVCECNPDVVSRLQQDFKKILQQQTSLEQWALWLDDAVSSALKPYSLEKQMFVKTAKRFLVNWSYYSSLVIRDLTLRSAASFGSFHLIHLLYNEYIFYLVEHKVAASTGQTPISVVCLSEEGNTDLDDFVEKRIDEKADQAQKSSSLSSTILFHLPSPCSSNSSVFLTKSSHSLPSTSVLQHPSSSIRTTMPPFDHQVASETSRAHLTTSGTKVTLVSNYQNFTPKTIIVKSICSSSTVPLNCCSPGMQSVKKEGHS